VQHQHKRAPEGARFHLVRQGVEQQLRQANISVVAGTGKPAIGIVPARIA